jgi:hypothetical protein
MSESTPSRDRVVADLESGKKIQADALVYAVGRQANGDQLGLDAAGLASKEIPNMWQAASRPCSIEVLARAGNPIMSPAA